MGKAFLKGSDIEMNRESEEYKKCIDILNEELLPAMGCTEPIAVAYCAAIAGNALGEVPDHVKIEASGNIIKNVKSVIVPNTGYLKGLPVAAAAGIIAGDPEKKLQVISDVSIEEIAEIKKFVEETDIDVELLNSGIVFDLQITLIKGANYAKCRIVNYHTNVVLIEKNGKIIEEKSLEEDVGSTLTDREFLNCEIIYDFVNSLVLDDVKSVIGRQIQYNMAISREGIEGDYGAHIGKTILNESESIKDEDNYVYIKHKAKAWAAAGSDARMNGCELPVVINSGSGNQGITASVPVVIFGEFLKASEERIYKAVTLSNLIAIYQKYPIGRLSAYCGAVNAGAGAACGIAYLYGAGLKAIEHTLVNALAVASGVVCDGAKASCAAKIALAVENGLFGYEMWKNGNEFMGGDGIIKKGSDNVVKNVGRLASRGMKETDKEILQIMLTS